LISFDGLGKTYRSLIRRRAVRALSEVTLTVAPGQVLGIAGPNGAGKSTLVSLLLGFLAPTEGRLSIDGQEPRSYVRRHGAGYLPELIAMPARWRLTDSLHRAGALARLDRPERRQRAAELIERLGLEEHAGKQVKQLSKGTLQRLGLAQALLGRHDLLVLDEPTHGLDPLWTQRFRDLIRDERRQGRVILIASHNLDELERVADRVAIFHRGKIERVVEPGVGATAGWHRVRLALPHPALRETFPGAEQTDATGREIRVLGTSAELSAALERVLSSGGVLEAFYPERSRLETAFREAVGEKS
jgi:ABC-type multidrug transport system ATPase subunit